MLYHVRVILTDQLPSNVNNLEDNVSVNQILLVVNARLAKQVFTDFRIVNHVIVLQLQSVRRIQENVSVHQEFEVKNATNVNLILLALIKLSVAKTATVMNKV